jgi:plastocyanin
MRHGTRLASGSAVALALLVAACGGDPKGPPPPPPSGLSVSKAAPTGDGQVGSVQTALANALRIVVLNDGNPEPGAAVNWNGSGTAAAFNPASGTTDANGLATTTWTLPQESGTPTAQAEVSGASGSPVVFSATARPGAATSMALVSGNAQAGGIGLPADDPLVVAVTDQYGNGVSGVDVTWVVTQGFASVPGVTQSGTNGEAPAIVVYGQLTGLITVTATVAGLGAVQFNLIAGHLITVQNNQFVPSQLNISQANAYVVWKWTPDARNHNVTPDLIAPTSSGTPTDGPHTYVFQFTSAANYAFYCIIHGGPGGQGMSGLISVN